MNGGPPPGRNRASITSNIRVVRDPKEGRYSFFKRPGSMPVRDDEIQGARHVPERVDHLEATAEGAWPSERFSPLTGVSASELRSSV